MIPKYPMKSSARSHQLRQDLRVPASFLVNVVLDNGRAVFGKLEDLSLNGAKLRLPVCLTFGSLLAVDFADHQLKLRATCRWAVSQDWNRSSYLTGIRFIAINPQQYAQLRQILFNLVG